MKKMLPRSWIFWKELALKRRPFKQHQMRTRQKIGPLVRPWAAWLLLLVVMIQSNCRIAPLKKRPQMAVIPTGTTNDFARAKIQEEILLKQPRLSLIRPFRWMCGRAYDDDTSSILRLLVPLRN